MLMAVFRPVRLPLLINRLRNKLKWDPNTRRVGPRCKRHTSTLLIGGHPWKKKKKKRKATSPEGAGLGVPACNNGNFLSKVKIEGGFFTHAGAFTKALSAREGNLKLQLQNPRRQGPTPEQQERLK